MHQSNTTSVFKNFPKKRPPLPKEFEAIYAAHYKSNREGQTAATSLSKRMEAWMHRRIADDVIAEKDSTKVTLELGAGTLNQLEYEPAVQAYDIIEPFTDLYKASPLLGRVRNIYSDISEVPGSSRYDRITSVAALEHVCNLPEVVARSGLLLAENGVLRTSIPSEGTLLWTMGWKLTTGVEFRIRHGLDYGILMKHEHVNRAMEIEEVLKYFFNKVDCKVFGLCKSLSLYRYYESRDPKIDRCREFSGTPDAE